MNDYTQEQINECKRRYSAAVIRRNQIINDGLHGNLIHTKLVDRLDALLAKISKDIQNMESHNQHTQGPEMARLTGGYRNGKKTFSKSSGMDSRAKEYR